MNSFNSGFKICNKKLVFFNAYSVILFYKILLILRVIQKKFAFIIIVYKLELF